MKHIIIACSVLPFFLSIQINAQTLSTSTAIPIDSIATNFKKLVEIYQKAPYEVYNSAINSLSKNEYDNFLVYLNDKCEPGNDIQKLLSETIIKLDNKYNVFGYTKIKDPAKYYESVRTRISGNLAQISKDLDISSQLIQAATTGFVIKNKKDLKKKIGVSFDDLKSSYSDIISKTLEKEGIDRHAQDAAIQIYNALSDNPNFKEQALHTSLIKTFLPDVSEELGVTEEQLDLAITLATEGVNGLIDPIAKKYKAFQNEYLNYANNTLNKIESFADANFDENTEALRDALLKNLDNPKKYNQIIAYSKGKLSNEDINNLKEIQSDLKLISEVNDIAAGAGATTSILYQFGLIDEDEASVVNEAINYGIAVVALYTGQWQVAIMSIGGMMGKPQKSVEQKMLEQIIAKLDLMDVKLDNIIEKIDRIDYKLDSLHFVEMKRMNKLSEKIDSIGLIIIEKIDESMRIELSTCSKLKNFDISRMKLNELISLKNELRAYDICANAIEIATSTPAFSAEKLKYHSYYLINDQIEYGMFKSAINFFDSLTGSGFDRYMALYDDLGNNEMGDENRLKWNSLLEEGNIGNEIFRNQINNEFVNSDVLILVVSTYLKIIPIEYMHNFSSEEVFFSEVPQISAKVKKELILLLNLLDVAYAQHAILSGVEIIEPMVDVLKGSINNSDKLIYETAINSIKNNPYIAENLANFVINKYIHSSSGPKSLTEKMISYDTFLTTAKQPPFFKNDYFKCFKKDDLVMFEVKDRITGKEIHFKILEPQSAVTGVALIRPELYEIKRLREKVLSKLYEIEFSQNSISDNNYSGIYKLTSQKN